MPEPGNTFASLFEQLRLARGYAPADVARKLDVSQAQVSRWRSGQAVPAARTCEKIAALFGVDQNLLLRLAGWLANNDDAARATIDPVIAALYDDAVAEVRSLIEGVPAAFVPTILAATRVSTRLARENVEAALNEALKQVAPGQSLELDRADPARAEREAEQALLELREWRDSEEARGLRSGDVSHRPHVELSPPDEGKRRDGKGGRPGRKGQLPASLLVPAGY